MRVNDLLTRIAEQANKQQFLNAAHYASELERELLRLLSIKLKAVAPYSEIVTLGRHHPDCRAADCTGCI